MVKWALGSITTGDCCISGEWRKHPLLLLVWRQNLPLYTVHYTCKWTSFKRSASTLTKARSSGDEQPKNFSWMALQKHYFIISSNAMQTPKNAFYQPGCEHDASSTVSQHILFLQLLHLFPPSFFICLLTKHYFIISSNTMQTSKKCFLSTRLVNMMLHQQFHNIFFFYNCYICFNPVFLFASFFFSWLSRCIKFYNIL